MSTLKPRTGDYLSLEQMVRLLDAYEKQWTDMDYTIGHLRQENEVLIKDNERLQAALINSVTPKLT